jgi:hypothetical protein
MLGKSEEQKEAEGDSEEWWEMRWGSQFRAEPIILTMP